MTFSTENVLKETCRAGRAHESLKVPEGFSLMSLIASCISLYICFPLLA